MGTQHFCFNAIACYNKWPVCIFGNFKIYFACNLHLSAITIKSYGVTNHTFSIQPNMGAITQLQLYHFTSAWIGYQLYALLLRIATIYQGAIFIRCKLPKPLWLLLQNTVESIAGAIFQLQYGFISNRSFYRCILNDHRFGRSCTGFANKKPVPA